jgi:hypothetical protein
MKKIYILWLLLFFMQQIKAQVSEFDALQNLKKIKCLAKMTNCKPRQAFYQTHVNYWQCYLDNNFKATACNGIVPNTQMPDCPEDDLNFPPNQYTQSYLDKCIVNMQVTITKKNEYPPTAQTRTLPPTEVNVASLDISGLYFIANESNVTGNIGGRIEIREERINDKDSQISIFSEGQEVVSLRRRNNARIFSGYWDYVHQDREPKFDRLRIKRVCEIKINPNGEGLLITMQNVKLRPKGGLFVNVVNIWDLSNKGYNAIDAAQNMSYEFIVDKGTTVIEYLKKN